MSENIKKMPLYITKDNTRFYNYYSMQDTDFWKRLNYLGEIKYKEWNKDEECWVPVNWGTYLILRILEKKSSNYSFRINNTIYRSERIIREVINNVSREYEEVNSISTNFYV